ncbi:hypothetical protein GCM10009775_22150 [Microbacterium aoyamense]|uniref:DUF222 domain-containing protein n=1 Tax=Microbacterium aoyamense TaxID=344166 RepID=A0ABP5B3S4_9MICO|nr:hypothetical protein [Microbacterium aoyamense]
MSVERAYDLAERMRQLGAEDPEEWAESELTEDIAQEARWLVIRRVREAVTWTNDNVRNLPEVAQLLDAGTDARLVLGAMREVAREAAFAVLDVIDEGADPDAPEDAPGWVVMETRFGDDGEVTFSGRDVGGLHESLGFPNSDGIYQS